jgi:hypothetical protein
MYLSGKRSATSFGRSEKVVVVPPGFPSSALMADLKPRMPSPIPLPGSVSFFGRTLAAIPGLISDASVETDF